MHDVNVPEFENYLHCLTEDGSPSLRLRHSAVPTLTTGELMHHQGGALTETLYIYQPVLDWACENTLPLKVVSVGLGLGYNEMLSAARAAFWKTTEIEIISYEKDPFLRENFKSWLRDEGGPLSPVYDLIASQMAKVLSLDLSSLGAESILEFKGTAILFDAFSQKTSPDLWNYDFLKKFVQAQTCESCALGTYASTTLLKKVLLEEGFDLRPQKGFLGKRESTFAVRLS